MWKPTYNQVPVIGTAPLHRAYPSLLTSYGLLMKGCTHWVFHLRNHFLYYRRENLAKRAWVRNGLCVKHMLIRTSSLWTLHSNRGKGGLPIIFLVIFFFHFIFNCVLIILLFLKLSTHGLSSVVINHIRVLRLDLWPYLVIIDRTVRQYQVLIWYHLVYSACCQW